MLVEDQAREIRSVRGLWSLAFFVGWFARARPSAGQFVELQNGSVDDAEPERARSSVCLAFRRSNGSTMQS